MKPVEQTLLSHPEGNCFAACLASILELPLEEVPNFKGDLWRFRFNEWLQPHGVSIVTLALPESIEAMKPHERRYFLPGYCILAAESPRYDCLHAVVCLDGVVVHDPHPQRDMGLGAWKEVDLLVALDASRVARTFRRRNAIQKPCITETRRVWRGGIFRWNHKAYRATDIEVNESFTRYGVGVRDDGSVYLRDGSVFVSNAVEVTS